MAKKKTYVETHGGTPDYSKQYMYPKGTKRSPLPAVRQKVIRNKQRANKISLGSKAQGYPVGVLRKMHDYTKRYRNALSLQRQAKIQTYAWESPTPKFMPSVDIGDARKYPTMRDPWGDTPKSVSWDEVKSWQKSKNVKLGTKGKSFKPGVLAAVGVAGAAGIAYAAAKGVQRRKRKERSDKGKKRGKYKT